MKVPILVTILVALKREITMEVIEIMVKMKQITMEMIEDNDGDEGDSGEDKEMIMEIKVKKRKMIRLMKNEILIA